MHFKIVYGPANSGKSQALARQIVDAAAEACEEKFIAVVPEQFTLQMQQRIVSNSARGAVMNVDIVSFNRLAVKVFDELGINLPEVLDDTGKALILRKVLEENASELMLYKKKVRMEGFIEEIKSVLTELKTYGVKPEDLEELKDRTSEKDPVLSEKLSDISLIYTKFNEEIENTYSTSEEVPDLFARVMPRSALLKDAHIYLDGFTGFTPVQYRIIEGFFSMCSEVVCAVTLPIAELGYAEKTSLFYMANETIGRLTDLASLQNIKTELVPDESAQGVRREADLINGPEGNKAQIFEYIASGPKQEAFFAAKKAAQLVRFEGFRYKEIAVVTTDTEKYYPYLEKAFGRLDIPVFTDHRSRISSNALARSVLSALKVVRERFSYDSVFSYLKCGLSVLDTDETDRLENYCIEFGIKGPVIWSRPFIRNRTLKGGRATAWDLEEINALRERFMASFAGFAAAAKRAKTAADYKAAFEKLFEINNIKEKLAAMALELKESGKMRLAEEYEQIFDVMEDLLEKAKILTKDTNIGIDEYISIIKNGIKEIKIGLIPPTLDMITAGDLQRSRLSKIRALFILGADESNLPKEAKKSGILTGSDRAFLKSNDILLAPDSDESFLEQRYYIYLMLNKPKNYLFLCRSKADESGQALLRSAVFDELSEYMPGDERIPKAITDEEDEFCDEEAGLELLALQTGDFARSADENKIDPELLSYFARVRPARTAAIIESAFYTNTESRLDADVARALYGENLTGSVSRFETFNVCAFRHYMRYGLEIGPRPEFKIRADVLGNVYHSALEKYMNMIFKAGFDLRTITDEQSRALAEAAGAAAVTEVEDHVFESGARNLYQAQRTIEVVVKTTDAIRERIKDGRFDVEAAELRFKLRLEDESLFTGIIDRIDIYDNGDDIYVNIVDYKTGSKKFNLQSLSEGTQLQLPVYLKSALYLMQDRYPARDVHPAGVYYYLVNDDFKSEEKKADPNSNISGCFESEERLCSLMEYTDKKLLETGKKIRSGDVSPSPLKEGESTESCEYCEFKEICRFKEGEFKAQARQAEKKSKKELEDEIYGGD